MLLFLRYNPQVFCRDNFLDLIAGMNGPGANRVQAGISLPVAESFARLASFVISQREVVMRVSICRSERNCGVVSVDRVLKAAGFVEYVA